MKKGNRTGTGKVMVNGKVMTTEMYQTAVEMALMCNGNNWMTVNDMISWASRNKLCEKKNSKRKANSHPLWKIVSNMEVGWGTEKVLDKRGSWGNYEYRLIRPKFLCINGEPCVVTYKDDTTDENEK